MLDSKNNIPGQGNSAAGFTLLEVMVALSVLAIVLVAVYRMQSQTIRMTTAEKFYATAPFLTQGKTAMIMATGQEMGAGDSGDFGTALPGYTWTMTLAETETENLIRMDVTILFNDGEFTYNLKSYCYLDE